MKSRQKKRLGQVFIHDMNIIRKILQKADVQPTDVVVEIGCGEGILSESLAQTAKELIILELDPAFLERTRERLSRFSNVTYLAGDALDVDWSALSGQPIRIIANIPYYISAKIIKKVIEHRKSVIDAVMMVQSEFADKLIAKSGETDYTSLTVYSSYYLYAERLFDVSRNCFTPIPNVDSSIIRIRPRDTLPFVVDPDIFFAMVRTAFWGRRKPYVSALTKSPYIRFSSAIREMPLFQTNPGIRGEKLGMTEFFSVYDWALNNAVPYQVLTGNTDSDF